MLRYIKRKVNETREENGNGDATATTLSDPSTPHNGSNHYDTAAATTNSNNTAGGVARNISNKIRNRVNNSSNSSYHTLESLAEQQRQLDTAVLAPLSHLANFDACIGAADALAAASPSQPSSDTTSAAGTKNIVADCSVLVSPDGDLLLMPQQNSTSSSSVLSQELGDDYKAAIYVGNDYCPPDEGIEALTTNTAGSGGGDAHRNGFTGNGWSIPAASLALRQTEQSLHDFADFCEEIVLSKKEAAARSSVACDKLLRPNNSNGSMGDDTSEDEVGGNLGRYPLDLQQDAELMKQTTSASGSNSATFDVVPGRVGPMRFQGGTLHAAHVALEDFYYKMAECESNRWRLASFQPQQSNSGGTNNSQGLPALRKAATKAEERSSNRQKTLREMYGRVKLMEDHLSACQQFANARWKDVQLAEERVTKLIEERTLERSRKREKQRLQEFHQAGVQQQQNQQQNQLGANKEEIWNLVSQVSESMENGSFEPINFPQQQLTGEPSATSPAPPLSPMEELPPLSRFDIEDEVGLQEYRMTAVAADRAVQDASGSLLNVLSSLDQVRRSARISAETNLLSSCQAQAACIRSIVKLERAAAEERLEHIKKLEKYADSIDVRSDLNIYIHSDRRRAGGSAPLGQDDDGGIASALAVLTSHQEGNMGTGTPSTLYNKNNKANGDQANGRKESVAEHVSSEALEDSLEALFSNSFLLQPEAADTEERNQAKAKFNEAVKLLCDIAEEKSLAARPKRSRMCYALNAKRASHTEIKSPIQFDGLCKVFVAILNGCDCESGGVSNAKMCMMLSQSFYLSEEFNGGEKNEDERSKRVYIKNRLIGHPLWDHEEFW